MNYTLLDSGNGRRLEKIDSIILDRPDPEAIWNKGLDDKKWQESHAVFNSGWKIKKKVFNNWKTKFMDLNINLKLTSFKHIGIFPEQEFEWELIEKLTKECMGKSPKFLSLFGYTGISSLVALKNGALVTHVDGSRPAITWFKDNQESSGLEHKRARIILDDCLKFTEREVKRGNKYDAVIMDPSVYGHGPKGEKWDFSKDFPKLIDNVSKVLSENPLFVIVNAYAVSNSHTTLKNILEDKLKKYGGELQSGELQLKEPKRERALSTGKYAIWINKNPCV